MKRIQHIRRAPLIIMAFLLASIAVPQKSVSRSEAAFSLSADSVSVSGKKLTEREKEEAKKARRTEKYEKKRAKKLAKEKKRHDKQVAKVRKEQEKYAAKMAAIQPQRVYIFGGGVNFLDSVAFVTELQCIDSLYIEPDGELRESYAYSGQLKFYLESTYELHDETCAVFYELKEKKAVKRLEKMKAKLRKRGYFIHPVMKESFRFTDASKPEPSSATAGIAETEE